MSTYLLNRKEEVGMNRHKFRIGKQEVVFMLAVCGLTLMTIGAVFFKRSADTALVTGFIGLLVSPVFFSSTKKGDDE